MTRVSDAPSRRVHGDLLLTVGNVDQSVLDQRRDDADSGVATHVVVASRIHEHDSCRARVVAGWDKGRRKQRPMSVGLQYGAASDPVVFGAQLLLRFAEARVCQVG